jgi:hypothetical protein
MYAKDPKKILISKSLHLTPEEIAAMTEAEAWKAVYEEEAARSKNKDRRLTAPEKVLLETVASTEKGLRTVPGVNQSLKYLCVGPNAGPSKLEKAKEQGCTILSEHEFYAL